MANKVAIAIPKDQKGAVETFLSDRGEDWSFIAPYSDDGGATHTHYVAHGDVAPGFNSELAQLRQQFGALTRVTETEDNRINPRVFIQSTGLVPFEVPV